MQRKRLSNYFLQRNMKPNKQYKAIMLEMSTAIKLKVKKPDSLTMSQFIESLLTNT